MLISSPGLFFRMKKLLEVESQVASASSMIKVTEVSGAPLSTYTYPKEDSRAYGCDLLPLEGPEGGS